jgi:glutathione S-transferase
MSAAFVFPNVKTHLKFLEDQLKTSGGDYLCGPNLTAADILMSFPLMASRKRIMDIGKWEGGSPETAFPVLAEYISRLEASPAYIKSTKRIEEIEAKQNST